MVTVQPLDYHCAYDGSNIFTDEHVCGKVFTGPIFPGGIFTKKYPNYYMADSYNINVPTLVEVIEVVEEKSIIIFHFDDYMAREYTFINSINNADFIYRSREVSDAEIVSYLETSIFSLDISNMTETFGDMYECAYLDTWFGYKGERSCKRAVLRKRLSHKQLFTKMCADLDGYLELFKEHNEFTKKL
jgi:hypothetical protein